MGKAGAGLDSARPQYEYAFTLCDNDPRLPYAWGLVCLKNDKLTESQKQFECATGHAGGGYLPAWQALARTQILRGKLNLAIDTLSQFSRVMEVSKNHALSEAGKEHYVDWLGRAVLLLKQNARNSRTLEESVEKADARFSAMFHASLRAAYDSGKVQVAQWYLEAALDAEQRPASPRTASADKAR